MVRCRYIRLFVSCISQKYVFFFNVPGWLRSCMARVINFNWEGGSVFDTMLAQFPLKISYRYSQESCNSFRGWKLCAWRTISCFSWVRRVQKHVCRTIEEAARQSCSQFVIERNILAYWGVRTKLSISYSVLHSGRTKYFYLLLTFLQYIFLVT